MYLFRELYNTKYNVYIIYIFNIYIYIHPTLGKPENHRLKSVCLTRRDVYIYIYVIRSQEGLSISQVRSFLTNTELCWISRNSLCFFGETTRRIWRTLQWFRVNEPVGRCGVFRSSEMTPVLRVQWSLGHPCFCWSILKFSHTTRRFKGCIVRVCSPF